jgi:drug/metabolite transporter (DMT)-like permease
MTTYKWQLILRRKQTVYQNPQTSGQIYLWLAIIIFGTSSAVTRKLTDIGSHHLVDGRNPISLCNVLFVGNLCALIVLIAIYRKQLNRNIFQQVSRQESISLILVAILSGAIAPALIFQALVLTQVNNVVLIGRIEPSLTLALSVLLLSERLNFWQIVGAISAFFGITLTIFLQPPHPDMMSVGSFHIGIGEVLAAIGAIALAVSAIIGKRYLSHVPIGIYTIVRTGLGTVIFFWSALIIYGKQHFQDAFSPFLWKWMLLYGVVIVVIGQLLWIKGLRATNISTTSSASFFTPIVGIFAAYVILRETPTKAQYIGGCAILVGIFLSHIGIRRHENLRQNSQKKLLVSTIQEIETKIGFKGV